MELNEAFEIITIIYERFLWSSTIPGLKGLGIGHTIKNTIDKSIANKLVKTLNTCKCCSIHQIDRPSSLENYLGWNCKYCTMSQGGPSKCHGPPKCSKLTEQIYEQFKPKECKCSCRCISRHICRIYGIKKI